MSHFKAVRPEKGAPKNEPAPYTPPHSNEVQEVAKKYVDKMGFSGLSEINQKDFNRKAMADSYNVSIEVINSVAHYLKSIETVAHKVTNNESRSFITSLLNNPYRGVAYVHTKPERAVKDEEKIIPINMLRKSYGLTADEADIVIAVIKASRNGRYKKR